MNSSEDMNNSEDMSSRRLCDLTQSYSFVLQSVLGVLAFSTLICKWTTGQHVLAFMAYYITLFSSEAFL